MAIDIVEKLRAAKKAREQSETFEASIPLETLEPDKNPETPLYILIERMYPGHTLILYYPNGNPVRAVFQKCLGKNI